MACYGRVAGARSTHVNAAANAQMHTLVVGQCWYITFNGSVNNYYVSSECCAITQFLVGQRSHTHTHTLDMHTNTIACPTAVAVAAARNTTTTKTTRNTHSARLNLTNKNPLPAAIVNRERA